MVLKNATKQRQKRIIVLEDLDFLWDEDELEEVARLWKIGLDVRVIAGKFNRDPDDILLALIHLAKEDRVFRRIGGLTLGL
ncbi:hypothetical protein MKX78_19700 [Cytobacillus sp. FSL R5-0569]|uniref:hypothetical protein n=1 Tax=Cytobacillus sp. FSL R5-0569 TaxID=2921649 RepID=UPI0030FA46AF